MKTIVEILLEHGPSLHIVCLFSEKVCILPKTGCWLWTAGKDKDGYGIFSYWDGKRTLTERAHRFSYRCTHGEAPEELDHFFCDMKACVHPFHTIPTTTRDNTLRSNNPAAINARKTHCPKGHPLFGDNLFVNTKGSRVCRACQKIREMKLCLKRKKERRGSA